MSEPIQKKSLVMVVDDNNDIQLMVRTVLSKNGFEVTSAYNGVEALATVGSILPDLMILDIMMPEMDGITLLKELRLRPDTRHIPVIMLTARDNENDLAATLGLGADDFLGKPFKFDELVARVRSKIARPPVPVSALTLDSQTNLISEARLKEEVERELERSQRGGGPGCLALLDLAELGQVTSQFGLAAVSKVLRQVSSLLNKDAQNIDTIGWNQNGSFMLLLPGTPFKAVKRRLEVISSLISSASFEIQNGDEKSLLRFTPIIGFSMFEDANTSLELIRQTRLAHQQASALLDMQPYHYHNGLLENIKVSSTADYISTIINKLQIPIQITIVILVGWIFPFFLYIGLDALEIDIAPVMYSAIVISYLILGAIIWAEGLLSSKIERPTAKAENLVYPTASAIITAYLPECAASIIETIEKFLLLEYPGKLQIILSYHSYQTMPIEDALREISKRDPRLVLYKVGNSSTKAQNINAALANVVNGEFVGIFDANDYPDSDSFKRAWQWMVSGYDVVQGHTIIRNGDTSLISRLSAIETETYYAASLPGKKRLGRGMVFGGTNNYWRTPVLKQTRLRSAGQTSVTDMVMRVALAGYRIAYDPMLISRGVASVSWSVWANSLIRKAQGWYQVMVKHTWKVLWDDKLTIRQKLGYTYSLLWRELSRWLMIQVVPLSAFFIVHQDYYSAITLVLVSLLAIGPGQTLLTYYNAHPDVRKHKNWFVSYFFASTFYFIELKRYLACMGQVRELIHEPFANPIIRFEIEEDLTDDDAPAIPLPAPSSILIVDDARDILALVEMVLKKSGYTVLKAESGFEALEVLENYRPNLILSDIMMPGMDGFALLEKIRENPDTAHIPLIIMTTKAQEADIVKAFNMGADDYVTKPLRLAELSARVKAKIERPTMPGEVLDFDQATGLLSARFFRKLIEREVERSYKSLSTGCLAVLTFEEADVLRENYGSRIERALAKQVQALVMVGSQPLDRFGVDDKGNYLLLLPDTEALNARELLRELSNRIVNYTFTLVKENVRLTPVVGFSTFGQQKKSVIELLEQAENALNVATVSHDLQPQQYQPIPQAEHKPEVSASANPEKIDKIWSILKKKLTLPFQIFLTYLISFFIPLLFYIGMSEMGLDIAPSMYIIVVISLLTTAILIWTEGFLAFKTKKMLPADDIEYPSTAAIIAAYLPNEAATIKETIEAFLKLDYPGSLQVILAYNTPRPLAVEGVLQEMARNNPRFIAIKVENSTSKAQNVNAALSILETEFVGVFDADHHPDPDSFKRAWGCWLSQGYDVVQGHCLVRNGDATWVARMVAVEFEAIYAVSHPGRERLHDFGIFGGSNGYWRTSLLRQTRMHGFMLTEDIDSSMRVTLEGYKIGSDPHLVSRELATVSLKALWNQRMRWAQGWFQVSLKHTWSSMTTAKLNLRQKLGMLHLLAWREIYPWISGQVIPIVIYWIWKYGGTSRIDWFVPVFFITTLFTLSVGPGQTFLAYLLSDRQIKERVGWYYFYLFISMVFYTEFKNLIARVAQIKEAMLERSWKITPRASSAGSASSGGIAPGA